MKKLKQILPSLREKKRYLAFDILSKKDSHDYRSVSGAISASCIDLVGKLGLARAGVIVLENCFEKSHGILKFNPNYTNEIKSALSFIEFIDKQPVIVRSLGVSGIIKKAKKFAS